MIYNKHKSILRRKVITSLVASNLWSYASTFPLLFCCRMMIFEFSGRAATSGYSRWDTIDIGSAFYI